MTDHLALMGIQRWQQRPAVSKVAMDVEAEPQQSDVEPTNTVSVDEVIEPLTQISQPSPSESLVSSDDSAAYAAISVRQDNSGQSVYWLWVVPQATLPANELQLLDKIVAATGSKWEEAGVADNYLSQQDLDQLLKRDLSAVVLFSEKTQWPALLNHQLYAQKRCIDGVVLQELLTDAQKKRQVWQQLQTFM